MRLKSSCAVGDTYVSSCLYFSGINGTAEGCEQQPWRLLTRCQEHLLPSPDSQNCLQTLSDVPGGENCSELRTTGVCEAEMTPLNPFLDMLTALQKTHSGMQESWIQVLVLSQSFCMFCLSYLVCEMKDYLRYLGAHLPLSILTVSSYENLNTF